ncbi:MAG: hypothetical protein AB7E70_19530 [Hyphomicrobiaceae bacterium]
MKQSDIDRLRRITDATSQPSPWRVDKQQDRYVVLDRDSMWICDVGRDPLQAKFIAAASPDVVLALLDRIATLTALAGEACDRAGRIQELACDIAGSNYVGSDENRLRLKTAREHGARIAAIRLSLEQLK